MAVDAVFNKFKFDFWQRRVAFMEDLLEKRDAGLLVNLVQPKTDTEFIQINTSGLTSQTFKVLESKVKGFLESLNNRSNLDLGVAGIAYEDYRFIVDTPIHLMALSIVYKFIPSRQIERIQI